jgi:hypothetical protein
MTPRIPIEPSSVDAETFIGAEGTEAPDEPRRTGAAKNRSLDEMLDAALACTFPASDPIGCLKVVSDDDEAQCAK